MAIPPNRASIMFLKRMFTVFLDLNKINCTILEKSQIDDVQSRIKVGDLVIKSETRVSMRSKIQAKQFVLVK